MWPSSSNSTTSATRNTASAVCPGQAGDCLPGPDFTTSQADVEVDHATCMKPRAVESRIAQIAPEGMSNREIGAKLFISARTVEWHLTKVYPKLGVKSRRALEHILTRT
jgi:DNA-binding CsgD family transcriptional regulator